MEKELFCVNSLYLEDFGFMSQDVRGKRNGMIELEGPYPIMTKGDKFFPNETETKEILKGLVQLISKRPEKTIITTEELSEIKKNCDFARLSKFIYKLSNICPDQPLTTFYVSDFEYMYIKDVVIWNKRRVYVLGYNIE